jgi:hypothetical protein
MKQHIRILLSLLLMTACTQNNGHIGDLFGRWQLLEITTPDATVTADGTLFLCFQNAVVKFQHYKPEVHASAGYYGTFVHTDDSLFTRLSHDDAAVLDAFLISNRVDPAFAVKQLDRKHLTLAAGDTTWVFRKY